MVMRNISPQESVDLLQHLGGRVRNIRALRGMTRKTLAIRSRVSERYLAALEQGRGNISIRLLGRVASALEIEPNQLLEARDNQTPEQSLIIDLARQLSVEDQKAALQMLYEGFAVSERSKQRIALIGLRGAGKTTLGQRLSDHLNIPFVGLASVIEGLAGMSVSEVFSLSGELGYRRLEEQALYQILNRNESCVIETGGGIVVEPKLLNTLLTTCFVIWLKTAPEQYMERVVAQGDLRPMLNRPDAMANLRRLLDEREPFYAKAHATLDTTDQLVEESLRRLLQSLPKNLVGTKSALTPVTLQPV